MSRSKAVGKFATEPLLKFLELKSGEYFDQAEENKDVSTLIDLFGSQGHVFADIQPELRYLEEPGMLDVAYKIKEGEVFSVSEVNVHIAGEFPHTKQTVVLARLSPKPGDIIDTREVRNSERQLEASQLFAGTQNDGEPPRIVVRPPDLNSVGAQSVARIRNPIAQHIHKPPSQPYFPGQNAGVPAAPPIQPQPQAVQTLKPSFLSWEGRLPVPALPQPQQFQSPIYR